MAYIIVLVYFLGALLRLRYIYKVNGDTSCDGPVGRPYQ